MSAKSIALTVAALVIMSPSLAATSQTIAHHSAKEKRTSTAITKAAAMSSHSNIGRMAKKVSMRGISEVRALNALESHGYRQFTDLHAKGVDFVATARRNGKLYVVTVMPSGQIRAASA